MNNVDMDRIDEVAAGDASSRDTTRIVANLMLALVQPFSPIIAESFGGEDIATRSDGYTSLFTPPDFAFAIWGVIFIGMIVYGIHQALPSNRADPRLRRIGWFTAAAMALNVLWMIVTTLIGLGTITTLIIFAMLAALIMAFTSLYRDGKPSARDAGSIIFPVSAFAGWITVASIASASGWLNNDIGFQGGPLPQGIWVAGLAVVGSCIGVIIMIRNQGNIFYGAVLVWGLSTIAIKCAGLGETVALYGAIAGVIIVCAGYAYARRLALSRVAG